jgi:RimJ/RimL family protein N-acetyltransferase
VVSSLLPFWIPLGDENVLLRPLALADARPLAEAAIERTTYGYTVVPDGVEEAREYVGRLLEEAATGQCAPYVIVANERVVGATRLMSPRWFSPRLAPDVIEIGGTWLTQSHQRTGLNRAVKNLLLAHCFTTMKVGRVEFKTDQRNERSRDALRRLGAREEGVLRRAHPSFVRGEEGQARDSLMFSLLPGEWAAD